MTSTQLFAAGLLCLISSTATGANESPRIQVVDSYYKRVVLHSYADGKVDDAVTSYVKLRIQNKVRHEMVGSTTEVLLANDAKSDVGKPLVYQNADRTIIGFTTCAALLDYTINLVYISDRGEVVVDQDFNQKLIALLEKNNPATELDSTGLFLKQIKGRRLSVGFRSDSGKGSFSFRVDLTPDGQIKIVPKSILFDP